MTRQPFSFLAAVSIMLAATQAKADWPESARQKAGSLSEAYTSEAIPFNSIAQKDQWLRPVTEDLSFILATQSLENGLAEQLGESAIAWLSAQAFRWLSASHLGNAALILQAYAMLEYEEQQDISKNEVAALILKLDELSRRHRLAPMADECASLAALLQRRFQPQSSAPIQYQLRLLEAQTTGRIPPLRLRVLLWLDSLEKPSHHIPQRALLFSNQGLLEQSYAELECIKLKKHCFFAPSEKQLETRLNWFETRTAKLWLGELRYYLAAELLSATAKQRQLESKHRTQLEGYRERWLNTLKSGFKTVPEYQPLLPYLKLSTPISDL